MEEGASLLVVHPLEMVGRARDELVGHRPDGLELSTSALAVAHLQRQYESRLLVQWDLLRPVGAGAGSGPLLRSRG